MYFRGLWYITMDIKTGKKNLRNRKDKLTEMLLYIKRSSRQKYM